MVGARHRCNGAHARPTPLDFATRVRFITPARKPTAPLAVTPKPFQPRVFPVPDDQRSRTVDDGIGREAANPRQIPARGWKSVLRRALSDSGKKNLSLVAGGVTYYVVLALFPGLAALVSILALLPILDKWKNKSTP